MQAQWLLNWLVPRTELATARSTRTASSLQPVEAPPRIPPFSLL